MSNTFQIIIWNFELVVSRDPTQNWIWTNFPILKPWHEWITFNVLSLPYSNKLLPILPLNNHIKNRLKSCSIFFTVLPGCPNQPRIDFSYYEYVPRLICLLICVTKWTWSPKHFNKPESSQKVDGHEFHLFCLVDMRIFKVISRGAEHLFKECTVQAKVLLFLGPLLTLLNSLLNMSFLGHKDLVHMDCVYRSKLFYWLCKSHRLSFSFLALVDLFSCFH